MLHGLFSSLFLFFFDPVLDFVFKYNLTLLRPVWLTVAATATDQLRNSPSRLQRDNGCLLFHSCFTGGSPFFPSFYINSTRTFVFRYFRN